MKPKKTLSVYVLLAGVMGLLVVGGMVSFQIFREATKSQLTEKQREVIKPIDGKIEDLVVKNLVEREVFTKEDLRRVFGEQLIETTPTASPSASSSAIMNSTSSAIMNR